MLNRLWREPLLHFALAGAVLFAVFALADGGGEAAPDRIVVTPGKVEQLATGFARTWQRPPTAAELETLIDEHIREEVFYRQALEMGLDRDDLIVRRRMRQKMEFLAEDIGAVAQPGDAELERFVQSRGDAFRREPRVAFEQVYFRPEGGREAAAAAAARLARMPGDAGAAAIDSLGDPTLLPREFDLAPMSEIARVFGDAFAQSLPALDAGRWRGPVESAYGWHLVRVTERADGGLPTLDESREEVLAEWAVAQRRQMLDETYSRLRDRYEVVIERPATIAGAANGESEATAGESR